MTASQKVQMLRSASSLVTAAYEKVRLIPQESRALPLALFYEAAEVGSFMDLLGEYHR